MLEQIALHHFGDDTRWPIANAHADGDRQVVRVKSLICPNDKQTGSLLRESSQFASFKKKFLNHRQRLPSPRRALERCQHVKPSMRASYVPCVASPTIWRRSRLVAASRRWAGSDLGEVRGVMPLSSRADLISESAICSDY